MNASPSRESRLVADPDFPGLKAWIIERTGLFYYDDKNLELAAALIRSLGVSPDLAVPEIRSRLHGQGTVWDRLVEELTIGETFFFRHLEMFDALRTVVFPDIRARRGALKSLRIWSAGCSIGAEPYSLSILLHDMMASQFQGWKIDILATDINRRFLEIARRGVYEPWALRGLPPHLLNKCFLREGTRWKLDDLHRRSVHFEHHNLVDDSFPNSQLSIREFDLIICRNVMIYFDQPTIRRLADEFHRSLMSGGWLAIGHAEPHIENFRQFRTVNTPGAILYQRSDGNAVVPLPPAPPVPWMPPALDGLLPHRVAPRAETSYAAVPVPGALPVLLPESVLEEIRAMADRGFLEEALKRCDSLLASHSLDASVHFYRGVLLAEAMRWEEAGEALRRCLFLRRDFLMAHYHLGLVRERLGQSGARSFRNAGDLLATMPDEQVIPMGDELTVSDLRALVAAHFPDEHEPN